MTPMVPGVLQQVDALQEQHDARQADPWRVLKAMCLLVQPGKDGENDDLLGHGAKSPSADNDQRCNREERCIVRQPMLPHHGGRFRVMPNVWRYEKRPPDRCPLGAVTVLRPMKHPPEQVGCKEQEDDLEDVPGDICQHGKSFANNLFLYSEDGDMRRTKP